jgi:RNA polymerase sigma-70 factor (ECF subfamily)
MINDVVAEARCRFGAPARGEVRASWRTGCNAAPRRSPDGAAEIDRYWSGLMAGAQSGDRDAYDRLLRDIVPYIRTIAGSQHRSADRVDEVVQEVLLTVHRVRHTYDPARAFRPWLAAIARRRSIDMLRKSGRRAAHEVNADRAGSAYESYADPDAARLEDLHATSDWLGRAIGGLPANQREAIELLRLRQLSLAEAATLTGRSIGALKVNAHRALRSLRAQLRQG